MAHDDERLAMIEAGRALVAGGKVAGTAGNLSVRLSGRTVLATGSGADLGRLTPDDLVVVATSGRVITPGRREPTSELPLHLDVYRARRDVRAIVHAHAPASTAVGLVRDTLPPVHYYTVLLGGVVRVAEYALFGSRRLAAHVVAALGDRHAALLRNHGSITVGATLDEAMRRADLVEWLAGVYLDAASIGTPALLDERELAEVVAELDRRDYGRDPGDGGTA